MHGSLADRAVMKQDVWKLGLGILTDPWEPRPITLVADRLSYYPKDKVMNCELDMGSPRKTLVIDKRATISVTRFKDSPTEDFWESTVWKICFEDKETQIKWLAALTNLVTAKGAVSGAGKSALIKAPHNPKSAQKKASRYAGELAVHTTSHVLAKAIVEGAGCSIM
jgi:hypothetical protein